MNDKKREKNGVQCKQDFFQLLEILYECCSQLYRFSNGHYFLLDKYYCQTKLFEISIVNHWSPFSGPN